MGSRTRNQPERWSITVVPAGDPVEGELAARQALRMVAGWILQRGQTQAPRAQGEPSC